MNQQQASHLIATRNEITQRAAQFNMYTVVTYRKPDAFDSLEGAPDCITSAEDPNVHFCIMGLMMINNFGVHRMYSSRMYMQGGNEPTAVVAARILGVTVEELIPLVNMGHWGGIKSEFAKLPPTAESAATVINYFLLLQGFTPEGEQADESSVVRARVASPSCPEFF